MATLDEIGQEKQKVSERLARLDAERAKLSAQLNELEVAERVLTRFGRVESTERRRRGRPARTAPAPAPVAARGRARAAQPAQTVSLSDATLRAVQAHADGATASEVLSYLAREFGMAVRPNHLGIALQRHRRAGRLETRDSRWFLPHQASQSTMTA
jgi:transposase